jgi:DNA-binding Lrp family transcriptional regulator
MSEMPSVFVFITVDMGHMAPVVKKLKNIKGVKEAHMLYGSYDVVAKINADTMDELKEIVTQHVRRIDAIRTTLTMITME